MKYKLNIGDKDTGIVLESSTELSPEQYNKLLRAIEKAGFETVSKLSKDGVLNVDSIINSQPPAQPPAMQTPMQMQTGTTQTAATHQGGKSKLLEILASFASGLGESMRGEPSSGEPSSIKSAPTSLRDIADFIINNPEQVNKLFVGSLFGDKVDRLVRDYVDKDSLSYKIGKMLPPAAASIAGYSLASSLLPEVPAAAPTAIKILLEAAKGGLATAAGEQLAHPTGDIDKIKHDIALGAIIGGGAEGIAALAKSMAPTFWKSALGQSKGAVIQDIKRGKELGKELTDHGVFALTFEGLKRRAQEMIDLFQDKITPVLQQIKGKVAPVYVYEKIGDLLSQYLTSRGKSRLPEMIRSGSFNIMKSEIIPGGENNVKNILNVLDDFKKITRDNWLNAVEADDLKKTLWRVAKNVFEKDTAPIVKEAQASVGSGLRAGIQKLAEKQSKELGKELERLFNEQGMWLGAREAATSAAASIGKTPIDVLARIALMGGLTATPFSPKIGIPAAIAAYLAQPEARMVLAGLLSQAAKRGWTLKYLAPIIAANQNTEQNLQNTQQK
jgi:hypothetical protein